MTAEDWSLVLVWVAFPAANLFPILYMISASWWGTWAGRAVVVSKIGLAALVDASVLFRIHGGDYPGRTQVILVAFSLIVIGTYMYLFAFIREQYLERHGRT